MTIRTAIPTGTRTTMRTVIPMDTRMTMRTAIPTGTLMITQTARSIIMYTVRKKKERIMKNHISHCIVDAIEEDDMEAVEALNRAIDRFIK